MRFRRLFRPRSDYLFGIASSLFAAFLFFAALTPATARAELSDQDRADLARVEVFLNGIRSLQARFTQLSEAGGIAEGDFYMQRPGRLRFEYAPPSPILIVATGRTLIFYDAELGQVSRLALSATPLGFLVANNFSFSGDFQVESVERQPGALFIKVFDTRRPNEGSVIMVFADQPLQLRQWQILDAQGKRTTIALFNVRTNLALDAELFRFVDPDPFGPLAPPD
jgi:outer membrane lipoprotein-sorting protein